MRPLSGSEFLDQPGIGPGALGLAGAPGRFETLAERAKGGLGIAAREIVRDYWLTACLFGIVSNSSSGLMFRGGGNSEPLARCVFAGGTSLVSAWAITERYSEDLDLLVLTVEQQPTNSAAKRALGVPTGWVASSLNLLKEKIDTRHMGDVGFRRSHLEIGGEPGFLKIETTVEPTDDALFETRTVTSLMGRFATSDDIDRFPELGGFEMPCVVPGYTAANKFDALHRRAVAGEINELAQRGRDLYDLARIASSEHASEARKLIPVVAERSSASPGRRQDVPRPQGGYANSPAFKSGSESQDALKNGYLASTDLIWGQAPSFDEAVEMAVSLDST